MRRIQSLLAALAAITALATNAPEPAEAQVGTCVIRGSSLMPKDLEVFDAEQGGQAIAKFSGGKSALTITEFPSSGSGRAKIETGTGMGSFRITGFVDATKIPVYTARQVAVKTGHIWIGKHEQVTVSSATGSNLKVKKTLTTPINQTFSTTAPCSAFTLDQHAPASFKQTGHARGYILKQDSIELFDEGNASAGLVTVLKRDTSTEGLLLWSVERKGAYVHIGYHGAVVIDAWARAKDLQALPPGETMDQVRGPVSRRNPPRLQLAEQPKLVKTTKELSLQNAAGDSGKVIGKVEADTETYVIDTVAGWANVLPKSLHVVPVGDGQFWVKASELGL